MKPNFPKPALISNLQQRLHLPRFGKQATEEGGKLRKRKRKIRKLPIALAVVVAGGGLFAYHKLHAGDKNDDQTYLESTAEQQDIQLTLSATGTVEPANQYDVTAAVQGDVVSCTFEEGDMVKKGDVLYEVDKSDVENSISQAQLQLEQSQNNYKQSVESLDDLNVKSDKAGIITKVNVEEGDQVQKGTAIAEARDASIMELKVPFNASSIGQIGIGSAATVTMDNSFETLSGTVSAIDGADTVLDGYQIVRYVTIRVQNPGGLSTSASATATINSVACNQGANFTYLSEFTITAEGSGKITNLSIDEGSSVSAGQTVARLSSTETTNSVDNSRLLLAQQQLSYQNTVDKLNDYTITAPIDGTVITKNTKVGDKLDMTNGQTTLAVIYDLSYLTFDISLDELDVNKVAVGQTVNITCDSLTDADTFEGTVTKVSVAGTTSNGVTTYPVTVQIDNAPDGLLPGMNVDATIVVDEAADAIAIPVAAVQRGDTVYVKDDSAKNTDQTIVNGTLLPDGWKAVSVKTGLSDDTNIQITEGISVGDVVYVPQIQKSSSDDNQMMPDGGMPGGGMPGGGGAPSGGGGGMPGGGGGAPGGGGGGMP